MTATDERERRVSRVRVPAASWPTAHAHRGADTHFPSPLPNGPTGPGVCICIPGELFGMLQTPLQQVRLCCSPGRAPWGEVRWQFLCGRFVVVGLGHYFMSTVLLNFVLSTHCAFFNTLLRLNSPLN